MERMEEEEQENEFRRVLNIRITEFGYDIMCVSLPHSSLLKY